MPDPYIPTAADHVWNRACNRAGDPTGAELRIGDRFLVVMLQVHGYIMNGGVSHAVLDLPADELAEGLRGYQFFGLHHLVSIIEKAKATPNDDTVANTQYFRLGRDSILEKYFVQMFTAQPDYFAPLSAL